MLIYFFTNRFAKWFSNIEYFSLLNPHKVDHKYLYQQVRSYFWLPFLYCKTFHCLQIFAWSNVLLWILIGKFWLRSRTFWKVLQALEESLNIARNFVLFIHNDIYFEEHITIFCYRYLYCIIVFYII